MRRATVAPTDLSNFPRYLSYNASPSTPIPHSTNHCLRPYNHDADAPPIHPAARSSPPPEDRPRTFIALLKNSSKSTGLPAECLHSTAIKAGLAQYHQVAVGLLNLYAKRSFLEFAQKLFDEIPHRDTLAYTILISGYSRIEKYTMGLSIFSRMVSEGVLPNHFTLASVLRCSSAAFSRDARMGKEIHGWILRNGIGLDVVLQNSIMDFYAKSGVLTYAKRVFEAMTERDSVSWNIMMDAHLQIGDASGSMELFRMSPLQDVSSWNTVISGMMQNGYDMKALQLLYQMVQNGHLCNHFTYSTGLVLASKLAFVGLGRQIHGQILKNGLEHDSFIKNSLIDMYCKCGKVEASSVIFDRISMHRKESQKSETCLDGSISETISCSSMVAGYVQNGRIEEALEFFCRMLSKGLKVDQYTLTSIVAACSDAGILEQGRQVHAFIEKLGHGFDAFLASAVIDMYARCGSLEDAHSTFQSSQCRNVVLWTSIIGSYALYGQGLEAIELFDRMLEENIKPNEISFVTILSACSHSGLVREGYKYLKLMQEEHGLVPRIEHFTCMVDLLGRAGLLNDARDFILDNSLSHHSVVWRSLLSACRAHNNADVAKVASEELVRLEPSHAGSYILLSNIYSTKMKWKEASELRSLMQDRGVQKQPGQSWIQLKNMVHTFVAGDRSHSQVDEIYFYLESLIGSLKEMGHSSRMELVMHDVEEEH